MALISLPCPSLQVWGGWRPGPFALHQPGVRVVPPERVRNLLQNLQLPVTGAFCLRSGMPAGGGAGSSTAALVALARLAGWRGDTSVLAKACIAAEGASDSLMFAAPERLLWASRKGHVLSSFPALPRMIVLGGFWGAGQRTDAKDMNFPDISDLVQAWPAACASAARVAELALESARRCLALRGPTGDPTQDLARDMRALGAAIAHTGSARAFLFAPGTDTTRHRARLVAAGLTGITQFHLGGPSQPIAPQRPRP